MGRWGDKIYESDSTLDFFVGISDLFTKEISYLLLPERAKRNARWTANVLTIIEIMLLFERNDIGSTVYLWEQEQVVERWKKGFFNVWDAEWDDLDTLFPFHAYSYRQEYRPKAEKWLDMVINIVHSQDDDDEAIENLARFKLEGKLPYFSVVYLKTSSGDDYPVAGYFLGDLLRWLTKEIVFVLSDENRDYAIGFFEIENIFVAVDIMALLCENYRYSPSVTVETVEIWQRKTVEIWKARLAEEPMEISIEDDVLYQNVMARFEKLKILAQKYPSFFAL